MRWVTAARGPIAAIVCAVLAIVSPALAGPRAHSSIVGGTPSAGWRGLAYVHNDDLGVSCTGTIVSSNLVLTAAHCVVNLSARTISPAESFVVRTGTVDASDAVNSQTSGVVRVVVDPLFNTRTLTNDAALLQLATPATSLPLAIAGSPDAGLFAPGTPAAAYGWGLLNATDAQAPTTLHFGYEYVQSPGYCGAHDQLFVSSLEFCAVDPSGVVTTCHGDSGGPMLALRGDGTILQIGIVSRGVTGLGEDCNPDAPSVFTRVDALADWIDSWIAAVPAPAAAAATPVPAATAPAVTPAPTATPVPARHFHASSRHAQTWMTLSADGTRITKVRLALRVTCHGSWYANFDESWPANAALAPGRKVTLRSPLRANRYWTRSSQRLIVRRSADGRTLTATPSASARPRNRRLGTCSAHPPTVSAALR